MAMQERHIEVSPYHYCMKCWRRMSISELRWQLGYLVCDWDYDSMLIGEREAYMSRVLTAGASSQEELAPDKKLTQPFSNGIIEDIIL